MNLMANQPLAAPAATARSPARAAAGATKRTRLAADLSPRGFAIGLYLEHLEEASFLYEQRLALLDDRELGWADLADFEDRLEAHIDALVLGGELALAVCRQQALQSDVGEYHATISVICRHRRLDLLRVALEPLDPADDERIRAACEALARELPSEWVGEVSRMMSAGHAGLRRIAARVIGFRRLGAAAEIVQSLSGNGRDSLQPVWALGRLADAAAYPVLRRVFEKGQNGAVKKAAALALLRGGDQRVARTCLQRGRRHPSLLLLVGLAGGRDDLRQLLQLYAWREAGPDCLLALGLLGEISAIGPLMAALNNAATAEAAAVALNLITGAELYEQAVIPEVLEDDELFDEEPEGDRQTRSTVTRLTRDAAQWKAWWAENTTRFQPTVRYRGGRPYSPLGVLKTLTAERNQGWLRELAYQELVIRYGADTPFETNMLVVEQKRAIVSLEQWATVVEVMYQPGAWYFSGRPLEARHSSASALSEIPPDAGLTSVSPRH